MPAVALTDHGTMFGVIDFYNSCHCRRDQAHYRGGGLPGGARHE